jgi:vacuolar-type H+-ATPase subunit H
MNEKRIQEVMEVERQAREVLESATREAEALPRRAHEEARELIEKARLAARDEARVLIAEAQGQSGAGEIVPKAEAQIREMEASGAKNFDRAVQYVLERVIGKE